MVFLHDFIFMQKNETDAYKMLLSFTSSIHADDDLNPKLQTWIHQSVRAITTVFQTSSSFGISWPFLPVCRP